MVGFFFSALTLVLLSHNHFPSPFHLLLLGKAGSGSQHRRPSCESRLETTLKSQSDKAKDTHAPLFSHFPFGRLSGQLSGLCRFAALDTVPRSSPHARGKLHSCSLRNGAWVEMLLVRILFSLTVLLLLHMAKMCPSSFSSLHLSA